MALGLMLPFWSYLYCEGNVILKPAVLVSVVLLPAVVIVCTTGAGVGEGEGLVEVVQPAVTTASAINATIADAAVTLG